jgi:type IV secretion system protein VirD4
MNPDTRRQIEGWGPQRQPTLRRDGWRLPASLVVFFVCMTSQRLTSLLFLYGMAAIGIRIYRRVRRNWPQPPSSLRLSAGTDPLRIARSESHRLGGGVYLGVGVRGGWRLARPQRAVLILGPPRSGKTSAVIIPALLVHDGPAVSTSTKPDVLCATAATRHRLGRIWQFDPTGTSAANDAEQLRWSPLSASNTWDGAMLMARAMVTGAGVGLGTSDQTHWSRRAQALLAPLLHAAALNGSEIDQVVEWVLGHEVDQPGRILVAAGAELAAGVMVGIASTEVRERSSIFSSAADAIDAYTSSAALAAARDPNFDAEAFVRSCATIYIDAPAERQHLAAPLVCGLLSEIREATYRAHRQGELDRRVLFALDEVANIAPLDELPAIASEGGGRP